MVDFSPEDFEWVCSMLVYGGHRGRAEYAGAFYMQPGADRLTYRERCRTWIQAHSATPESRELELDYHMLIDELTPYFQERTNTLVPVDHLIRFMLVQRDFLEPRHYQGQNAYWHFKIQATRVFNLAEPPTEADRKVINEFHRYEVPLFTTQVECRQVLAWAAEHDLKNLVLSLRAGQPAFSMIVGSLSNSLKSWIFESPSTFHHEVDFSIAPPEHDDSVDVLITGSMDTLGAEVPKSIEAEAPAGPSA